MARFIFKILAIFIIGAVGGIFADQIFWPYFVERPLFYQYNLEQQPVYVTERKEVTIQENTALQNAVEKVEKVVIGIKSETPKGEILKGSGLIITSDGLVVALNSLIPRGSDFSFFVDGKYASYRVLKRDLKNDLALVKLEESGLPTTSFADFERIKLGERVFLVGVVFSLKPDLATSTATGTDSTAKVVNEGIIKSFNENLIQTSIFEEESIHGSPLFDIEGRVVGLNVVGEDNKVSAIPVTKIRQFIGF